MRNLYQPNKNLVFRGEENQKLGDFCDYSPNKSVELNKAIWIVNSLSIPSIDKFKL